MSKRLTAAEARELSRQSIDLAITDILSEIRYACDRGCTSLLVEEWLTFDCNLRAAIVDELRDMRYTAIERKGTDSLYISWSEEK